MADMTSLAPGAPTGRPERVAVIGAGVSGLTAAHVLSATTTSPSSRATRGSAATRTPTTSPAADGNLRIDSGFIVHNEKTYPHLLRRSSASSTCRPSPPR